MWPFRRKTADHEKMQAFLRDFVDLTGFAKGLGVGGSVTVANALRKHGGWIGMASGYKTNPMPCFLTSSAIAQKLSEQITGKPASR